ncbi:hypothetical protein GGI16_004789 [Coemansia sp. S142-1]|nr:hypothetical protein GGI16_004789 [Coemansia sp. S142-1]
MPTVEQNKHIIDYEAVAAAAMGEANSAEGSSDVPQYQSRVGSELHHAQSTPNFAMDRPQQQSSRPGSMGQQRAQSFGAYNIPEPPPPEAQLARTSRRLLLWKRYQLATQGLAPDLCRLFVDASDIKQDHELFDLLIPQNSI